MKKGVPFMFGEVPLRYHQQQQEKLCVALLIVIQDLYFALEDVVRIPCDLAS